MKWAKIIKMVEMIWPAKIKEGEKVKNNLGYVETIYLIEPGKDNTKYITTSYFSRFDRRVEIHSAYFVEDKKKTPALTSKNKIDFSPAKKPFLIGHHFESIAGAGTIIGPILAVSYFGWLAVVLWISIGAVFIGAMHDYVTLIASVRKI